MSKKKGFHPQGAILHRPVHERKILLQEGFFMISFSWTDGPKKNRNIAGFELMRISYCKHFTTEPPGYTFCFIQYCWVMIHFPSQRLWKNWVTARFLSHSLSHTHTHPADTFYPFWLLRTHEVKLRSLLRNSQASRRVPSLLIISFSWIIGPNLIKNRQGARFELMLPKLKSNILTIGP